MNNYTPTWSRLQNEIVCIEQTQAESLQRQMQKKGDILQYNNNKVNLTKSQKYVQIAKGINSYRRKSFATQSETYTNPNFNRQVNFVCNTNKKTCFTTDKSDVPGPIMQLCYDESIPNLLNNSDNIQRVFKLDFQYQRPTISNVVYTYDEMKEQNIVSFDYNYDDMNETQIFLYVVDTNDNKKRINVYGQTNITIPCYMKKSCFISIEHSQEKTLSSEILVIEQPPTIDIIENNNNIIKCEVTPFINVRDITNYVVENNSYTMNNNGFDGNVFSVDIDNTSQFSLSANFNTDDSTIYKSYPITINPSVVLSVKTITLQITNLQDSIKKYDIEFNYNSPIASICNFSNISVNYTNVTHDTDDETLAIWKNTPVTPYNNNFKIYNITQDSLFYLQYIDNNIFTKSNILSVSLVPPNLTFTSYTNGKITLVINNNSPGNMLYKNNIALPNTSDITNITIDATSGDTFSYGIYPSVLSSIIKIPCSPRVKLNNVVQNDVTDNYNINIVVYYDDIIIEGLIKFVVSDIDDNIVQTE
jgi:hypothetical protein